MSEPSFCALESRHQQEPMPGLGAHPQANCLISWPMGRWTKTPRIASDMTEEERTLIGQLGELGWRVILMDRSGLPEDQHQIYLFPEARHYQVSRSDLITMLQALVEGDGLQHWHAGPAPEQVALCCTHGKKDKCCAKFGNASFKALTQAQQETGLPVEIWRSTHLGGCRLAGTAIVFPQRRKYGRIDPEHALPLLQAEADGRPYLPCYRGSPDLAPNQQCAEVAALDWLQQQGIDARVTVMSAASNDHESGYTMSVYWTAGDESDSGQLQVHCSQYPITRYGTCADFETGPQDAQYWAADWVKPCSRHAQVASG